MKQFFLFVLLVSGAIAASAEVLYQSDIIPLQDRYTTYSFSGYECWLFDSMTGNLTKIEPDFNHPEKSKYKQYTGISAIDVKSSRVGRFKFTLMTATSKILRITVLDSDTGQMWISTSSSTEFTKLAN